MKNSIKLIAAGLLFSTALIAPAVSHAAVGDDNNELDSKGQITFTPNTDPTNPIDPTDPTDPVVPIDPTDPTNPNPDPTPGTNGPLSIDYASNFLFVEKDYDPATGDAEKQKVKITSQDKTYYAMAQTYKDSAGAVQTGPNFVQVSDNRGSLAGWNLTVTQKDQFATADPNDATKNVYLDGAKITLNNGSIQTPSTSAKPSTVAAEAELTPNAVTPLITAAANEGAGTYQLVWGDPASTDPTAATDASKSVTLDVPGATTKLAAQYTTTLTWSLYDTPDGSATPAP